MWAYQDSCARAIELASKPAAALHFGPFYGPEQLTKLLAQHMEAFAVSDSVSYQAVLMYHDLT